MKSTWHQTEVKNIEKQQQGAGGVYPMIFWAANINGVCPLQSGLSTS